MGTVSNPDFLVPVSTAVGEIEQAPCPVEHFFGPGVYIRQVTMFAGTFAIGHLQRAPHLNVILCGKVVMFGQDGGPNKVAEGPATFMGTAGRKCGVVLETVIWQNVYQNPDNERDIEVLEERHLDKSDLPPTLPPDKSLERDSFDALPRPIREFCTDDAPVPIPDPFRSVVSVRDSPIHGKGLFLSWPVEDGAILCPLTMFHQPTTAMLWVNHSPEPTCQVVKIDGGWYLVASAKLDGCLGGSHGVELTVDYAAPGLSAERKAG